MMSITSSDLFKASYKWWTQKRPIEWSEQEHLDNPFINTNGKVEQRLALEVSELIKKARKRNKT